MIYNSTDSKETLLANVARNKMHKGIVKLTFQKANGDIRVAIATTSEGIVATQTKSGRYLYDENHTPFFDLELGRWRSFCNDRLLEVETIKTFSEK